MNDFTQEEKHVLGFLGVKGGMKAGSFINKLIDAMFSATHNNQVLLRKAYPELMDAVLSWTQGNLSDRLTERDNEGCGTDQDLYDLARGG